jgi:hypothetical protein
VRLLGRSGESTDEAAVAATGQFRFSAGPGSGPLRVLAPRSAAVDRVVEAAIGVVADVAIELETVGAGQA